MKPPTHGRRGQGPRPATPRNPTDRDPRPPTTGRHGAGPRPPSHNAGQPSPAKRTDEPKPRDTPRLSLARPVAAPAPAPRPPSRERPHSPPRATETPRGSVWIYGLHAVAAALANRHRRLRRLVLTEEAQHALAARLPPPWPITPEAVERARLDTILGRDAVHQGVALLADPLASPALAQALERPGPVLVLDQVSDPRNVGAILRCAAAFSAACVITQERNAPDETGALAKAASGALESVPLLRAVNIARTLIALKAAGCWTVGLDPDAAPLSGPALAQRRVALVLGAEGEGLRRLTRETCDELSGIAMAGGGGLLDSLNVSASAAVALYELGRRG